ncbi:MAG TPA: hypothetical protein VMH50_05355 [Thermoleophilia bacterium]|nr:hypothetical protein [Thermoleophilia bacterium]
MRADRSDHSSKANKGVTMFKRVTIVALVVAAFVLMLAVPALATNGYRADYTVSSACAGCHTSGTFGAPIVNPQWQGTKHGTDAEAASSALSLPYGSVCAGCHTANYDPTKVTPVPTATSSTGAVSWAASPSVTTLPQGDPSASAPFSELDVGCSSCHYGAGPVSSLDGRDTNDTAHTVPYGNLADPQICGACHSRYSYTTQTYSVAPVPYLTVTTPTPGTPVTPNPSATTAIQPQMAIGYPMLGSPSPSPAWDPSLADYLNVQTPGWTPTPTATVAGFAKLQTYWKIDGQDSPWQQSGHEGSAAQYPEWASEGLPFGHADALKALTSEPFWASFPEATKQGCLECHSADFRILKAAGKNPTSADVKYGVTCVGCHAPHDAGTVKGVWDEEFDAQLNNDAQLAGNGSNLCTECHNGEIPEGTQASPGAEVHHPMKEMMDGYGAIDVASFPSVHKGKCIQCHMPPTSYSRGADQRGANHTFNIITPADAMDASPVPIQTASAVVTATPVPGGTPVITTTNTVTYDTMPYSACSTCHSRRTQPSPIATATTTATPTPGASPLKVTVTVSQNAAGAQMYSSSTNTWTPGGDRAIWLQDTIEQRQTWTKAQIAAIWNALDVAAKNMGYADYSAAQAALVAKPANTWTTAERAFLDAFTNNEFVDSEGSYGLHNWDYSREIVNKAMEQALIAQTGVVVKLPYKVTLSLSKSTVKAGSKVTFSGSVKTAKGVAGAGKVKILKRVNGVWKVWQNATLNSAGKYSLKVKLTNKGQFYFRTAMPADSLNQAGKSAKRKLVVN